MAEKILQTRIQLKYDTYANWQSSTVVLKSGEIAIATIPSGTTGSGSSHLPAVMAKVGDGTHTFSQLDWLQSVAADVANWAKAASKPTYNGTEISIAAGNGVAATNVQAAIKELSDSVAALTGGDSGSIADLIATEVGKLGLGTASKANVQTTGVSSNTTTLPTTAQVKSYVDGAIAGINGFNYEVVSSLPTAAAGTMHKIYLVAHSHGTNDGYDEYITLQSGSTYSWEKIGNTDVSLSNYYTKTQVGTQITNALDALDAAVTGTAGAGKTVTAFSQTNGKVTLTFSDIAVNFTQVSQTAGDVLVFNCGSSTVNV